MSSIGILNNLATLKASGKRGSNFPFSIALTVCLEISKALVKSTCVQSSSARSTLNRFFACIFSVQLTFLRSVINT